MVGDGKNAGLIDGQMRLCQAFKLTACLSMNVCGSFSHPLKFQWGMRTSQGRRSSQSPQSPQDYFEKLFLGSVAAATALFNAVCHYILRIEIGSLLRYLPINSILGIVARKDRHYCNSLSCWQSSSHSRIPVGEIDTLSIIRFSFL